MFSKSHDVSSEFFNNASFSSIDVLWETTKPKSLIIFGIIKNIFTGFGWYYMTCPTCLHEATMEIEEYLPLDGSFDSKKYEVYHCSNYECFEHIIKPLSKFKIKIEVEDDTDSTHLILFHDQAVQVLNKSAAELLKDNESEIKSLVGKLFAYKIQVTHEYIEKFDEVYDITAISSDYSVISHVKKSLLTKQEENIAKGKRNLYELYNVDPAFPSCSTKRPIIKTPLSDISNVDSPAERRKLRKIILDNKRSRKSSSSTNVPNILPENISSLQSSNNNKRSKKSSSSTNVTNILPENISSLQFSNNNKRSKKSSSSSSTNVPNIFPENISSLQSSNNIDRNIYSFSPHRSINHTSSLVSTITDNSRTKSTPSNENRRYSISPRINISNNQVVFGTTSTITRLSSGKRKLEHKKRDTTPIPMVNLDSDEDDVVLVRVDDPYKGVSKDYLDHGDQVLTCQICSAKLWTSEGGKGRITINKLCYGMCCGYGKVELPPLKDAHPPYQNLFSSTDEKSKFFQKNIRRYNSMFSFTSMGGKVDSTINKGNAPFIYRISGQNYHCIGSLKPSNGNQPQFCQLYIYDTENEITNRQTLFGKTSKPSSSNDKELDVEMIQYLRNLLDSENMLVKTYRMVRDHFHESPEANLKLRLMYKREKDGRIYNLPTTSEIAALVVGDIDKAIDHRDILVETQSRMLQRISELHPSYLALQYPLLFPYGDDGYRIDIPHRDFIATQKKIKPKLLQQFLVIAYTMIESERLHFIRRQQTKLRYETFENLQKHKAKGKQTLKDTGKAVILPSSFTGGARFMQQKYLDAMALCKSFGYPDFFITITCNPKWPEVKRFLKDSTIKAEDRPDILCRLFKIKLDSILKDLKDSNYLGEINAGI
ncbi:uncharacterized protein LOC110866652 [Helianthus annuus]|uniref:uncharacterized protein LOC110866652 n=1 Tax=Helianthus annuus TaxID=4232 RepID=UPI000B8FDD3B|nr:uncharacterized protein LOC110866652 [Helianthus annuus]